MNICIIGGGQLAMFLGQAASSFGYSCVAINNDLASPASHSCEMIDSSDHAATVSALYNADVITFESENIPENLLLLIKDKLNVYPSLHALSVCGDRLKEKSFLASIDVPVANFFEINNENDYLSVCQQIQFHGLIKARKGGYDGKGQSQLLHPITETIHQIISHSAIIEEFISFDEEISILSARTHDNIFFHYPITKNTHQHGILIKSEAPYIAPTLQKQAELIAEKILKELNYIGLAAVEFFVKDNNLIVNEIAPRVHNSGHWTLDGTNYNQFQCHLAAITNIPHPPLQVIGQTTMLNIIGSTPPTTYNHPNAAITIYDYHKATRPNRKCGHINITTAF